MPCCSMVNLRRLRRPGISYRPIQPSDFEALVKIHGDLFPIRYEAEFFHNVVNGRGIVSWGAVDRSRPDGQSDELIGFVTARILPAKESEVEDLLRFDTSRSDQTLVYILTLGVVESYRNYGIATSLIRRVIKYASNIPNCRAVYLHVISYNNPAIHLYKKKSFLCVRRLQAFYFINGQHYDAYLFIYYVNGGRSPCSPLSGAYNLDVISLGRHFTHTLGLFKRGLFGRNGGSMIFLVSRGIPTPKTNSRARELVKVVLTCMRRGFKSVAGRLWKNEERKGPKWLSCKENGCLLPLTQSKRMLSIEGTTACQFS